MLYEEKCAIICMTKEVNVLKIKFTKNREVKEMTVLTIRITEEEKEALQKISEKTDLSMSHIVRQLIKQFLKKHQ